MLQPFNVGDTVTVKRNGLAAKVVSVNTQSIFSLRPVYGVNIEESKKLSFFEHKELTLKQSNPNLNQPNPNLNQPNSQQFLVGLNQEETISKAAAIFNKFDGYAGGAISDWNQVEDQLFMLIANWFGDWLRYKGSKISMSVTLQPLQSAIGQYNTKLNKQWPIPTNTNNVVGLEINSLKSFLGAIHAIGSNENAHTSLYCLKLGANTYVFLDQEGHYARPYIINGTPINPNNSNYLENYTKLMTHGLENISFADVKKFITTGEAPAVINSVNVLVANYICESDRNWVHLLVLLLELGAGNTSFKSEEKNRYVMRGGSWKKKCSWGKGKNPHAEQGATDNDGYQNQRWLVRLVIEHTCKMDKNNKELWQKLIANYLGMKCPTAPTEIIVLLQKTLDNAMSKILKET